MSSFRYVLCSKLAVSHALLLQHTSLSMMILLYPFRVVVPLVKAMKLLSFPILSFTTLLWIQCVCSADMNTFGKFCVHSTPLDKVTIVEISMVMHSDFNSQTESSINATHIVLAN